MKRTNATQIVRLVDGESSKQMFADATFWKPGTAAPGLDLNEQDRDVEQGNGNFAVFNPNANLGLQEQRQRLPIAKYRNQILYLVENFQVVIIVGQTGCGKSTQIAQYLHEARWTDGGRQLCVTQPRRVAAISLATRVSEEMGVLLGSEVGYAIRFDDACSPGTKIKFMTDGLLLRETMQDPLLRRYSVIVLDEAHERTLHTDILLGLMKKILRKREDLRIIVSSATVEAEAMQEFFRGRGAKARCSTSIMSVEGRTYPVELLFLKEPTSNYLEEVLRVAFQIHNTQPPGDILIFLTGQDEINATVDRITEMSKSNKHPNSIGLRALPLYSGLANEVQLAAFQPISGRWRKAVVATNVAETSVTIDGIVYVIDCGFVKMKSYNPRNAMETLVVTPISQASAIQRAGRAGRTRPGKCFRLFTEDAYAQLDVNTIPEIRRTNLSSLVLQLKSLGIDNVLHFDFITPPPAETLATALENLFALGALDESARLTKLGNDMAEFPVEPSLTKMILTSPQYGCSEEIVIIAAMLSVQNVYLASSTLFDTRRSKYAVLEGDHITLLNLFNAFRAAKSHAKQWCGDHAINFKAMVRATEIRRQLRLYTKRFAVRSCSANGNSEVIRKCILSGFFSNVATMRPDGSYESLLGRKVLFIHPSSVLFKAPPPPMVMFHEVCLTATICIAVLCGFFLFVCLFC
jgi:ATP-dependent RNA helicase DDX35